MKYKKTEKQKKKRMKRLHHKKKEQSIEGKNEKRRWLTGKKKNRKELLKTKMNLAKETRYFGRVSCCKYFNYDCLDLIFKKIKTTFYFL